MSVVTGDHVERVDPSSGRCAWPDEPCDEPKMAGGVYCEAHAVLSEMSDDLTGEPLLCGSCGAEIPGENALAAGWIVKPSFRPGGTPWCRCRSCVEEWAEAKRAEERAAKLATALRDGAQFVWIRSKFDSGCAVCSEPISAGDKCQYTTGVVVHPGCLRDARAEFRRSGGGTASLLDADTEGQR